MKKLFLILVFLIVGSFTAFYFWASSSFINEDNYNQIVTFHPEDENKSDTLSVLTYNIGYLSGMTNNLPVDREKSLFSENLSQSIRLLKAYDFDLIGLQEVDFGASRSFYFNQFDSLGVYLDFHHHIHLNV